MRLDGQVPSRRCVRVWRRARTRSKATVKVSDTRLRTLRRPTDVEELR